MRKGILYLAGLAFIFMISGCVVRTYPLVRDRVDQNMSSGNRGYMQGKSEAPAKEPERRMTRTTHVVEVELHPPVKFEKMPKPKAEEKTEDRQVWGNRGYVTGTVPEKNIMGKDNAEIKPITLGGYSADAVLGKASGLSPNMANIRFDLFQGINSILGNTAYNPTQCPGSYNLGGVFVVLCVL